MKPLAKLRWGQIRKERRARPERDLPLDRAGDGEAPFVRETFNGRQEEREALRAALAPLRAQTRLRGEEMSGGVPTSWLLAGRWRCSQGHVSSLSVYGGSLGSCCVHATCRAPVFLTFPADVDGPLPTELS